MFLMSEEPMYSGVERGCEDDCARAPGRGMYRGTSSIKKRRPLGPYSRTIPRVLWGS